MSVLSDALQLTEAAPLDEALRLRKEADSIRQHIYKTEITPHDAERLKMKRDVLEALQERIDMLDRVQLRVDELLFQVLRCEGALQRARVELVAIRTGSSQAQVDSITGTLQATFNQVKEVQDELSKLGY